MSGENPLDDASEWVRELLARDGEKTVTGMLVLYLDAGNVGWRCFGHVSKAESAFFAAHLTHAVTCEGCEG